MSLKNFINKTNKYGISRCNKCANNEKFDFNFVRDYFLENDCLLLSKEYLGIKKPLQFKCSCGNISTIAFDAFKRGQRCRKCGNKRGSEKRTYKYEHIRNSFEKEGCVLLTTKEEYKNTSLKLEYICTCGNQSSIKFQDFVNGHKCFECSGSKRYDYQFVKNVFQSEGCELLEKEYKNNRQLLKYRCTCGEISHVDFYTFRQGTRCKKCGYKKNSGENHWNWNGGITSLTSYLRDKIDYWKFQSMKFNNYKCVITGERFDEVHHLYGFNLIIKELLEMTNIPMYEEINQYSTKELDILTEMCVELHKKYPLGVCLKKEVHDLFHSIYGRGDNTPEQFEEFKTNYLNGLYDHFFISKEAI